MGARTCLRAASNLHLSGANHCVTAQTGKRNTINIRQMLINLPKLLQGLDYSSQPGAVKVADWSAGQRKVTTPEWINHTELADNATATTKRFALVVQSTMASTRNAAPIAKSFQLFGCGADKGKSQNNFRAQFETSASSSWGCQHQARPRPVEEIHFSPEPSEC